MLIRSHSEDMPSIFYPHTIIYMTMPILTLDSWPSSCFACNLRRLRKSFKLPLFSPFGINRFKAEKCKAFVSSAWNQQIFLRITFSFPNQFCNPKAENEPKSWLSVLETNYRFLSLSISLVWMLNFWCIFKHMESSTFVLPFYIYCIYVWCLYFCATESEWSGYRPHFEAF